MFERIYIYDEDLGEVKEIFFSRPFTDFYTNGFIRSEVSYNNGVAGSFWPYELFEFDPGTGSYERNAFVDAWDGKAFPEDFDGNVFPADADGDGDKMLYYVYLDSQEGFVPPPIDVEELNRWLKDETYDAKLLDIRWQKITADNIKGIEKDARGR